MGLPSILPAVLGASAVVATTAIFAIHIVLASSFQDATPSNRATLIASAVLEGLVLAGLLFQLSSYVGASARFTRAGRFNSLLWFTVFLIVCTIAGAVSAAAVVNFNNTISERSSKILGADATGFLIGSAVALGCSFPVQFVFLIIHFIFSRVQLVDEEGDDFATRRGRRSPLDTVKSIPYHETAAREAKSQKFESNELRSPPGSSAGYSVADTVSSIRSSLSNVVRPISSRTRLLASHSQRSSMRSSRRPTSFDSNTLQEQAEVTEDGFDSWDTSGVDPQHRLTVLESSSPPAPRFLETIPASPTTSRSPSPGMSLSLEPPRKAYQRSRSHSPAPDRVRQAQRAAFTQQPACSESHIHPLFRSDSPSPPLIATPGTVVVAAPDAGKVITGKQSIRSLSRMRSGSLPAQSLSLNAHGSVDSFRRIDGSYTDLSEEAEQPMPHLGFEPERQMTPPIPEWILSAGSRSSLTDYHLRKSRSPERHANRTPSP